MAMHISKYCEVFDMKHLWSIWMHLNQLYVAKIYRLLWKLIVEAFASLSTCFSWYFDRDKYKLWFRSRRLTPFKSVCLTLLSINMTELACDCHPFFTHRNLQSNGWNIFFSDIDDKLLDWLQLCWSLMPQEFFWSPLLLEFLLLILMVGCRDWSIQNCVSTFWPWSMTMNYKLIEWSVGHMIWYDQGYISVFIMNRLICYRGSQLQ